MKMLNINY